MTINTNYSEAAEGYRALPKEAKRTFTEAAHSTALKAADLKHSIHVANADMARACATSTTNIKYTAQVAAQHVKLAAKVTGIALGTLVALGVIVGGIVLCVKLAPIAIALVGLFGGIFGAGGLFIAGALAYAAPGYIKEKRAEIKENVTQLFSDRFKQEFDRINEDHTAQLKKLKTAYDKEIEAIQKTYEQRLGLGKTIPTADLNPASA